MRTSRAVLPALLAAALAAGCAAPQPTPPKPQTPRVDLVTPMPTAFDVEVPGPEVGPAAANLSGIWRGDWQVAGQPGAAAAPHTLVVTRIEGAGPAHAARIIWSWAPTPGGPDAASAGFWELPGEVTPGGELRVPVPGVGSAAYRLDSGTGVLSGRLAIGGREHAGTFRRFPEWGLPPGSAGGPPAAPRQPR